MSLNKAAAVSAIEPLALKLDLSVAEAAAGMHRIVNAAMTDEIRRISLHRGEDPRGFALMLLGGGGPLHGAALAADLGMTTLVIPPVPGLLAAYGLLVADITTQRMRPFRRVLDDNAVADLQTLCEDIDRDVRQNDADATPRFEITAQMRYVGQSHELDVTLPPLSVPDLVDRIRAEFERLHKRVFGRASPERAIEVTALIATAATAQEKLSGFNPPEQGSASDAFVERRPVYFWELKNFIDTPVYSRATLPANCELTGPAIIEQFDTTCVLPPGSTARVDGSGSIIVTLASATS